MGHSQKIVEIRVICEIRGVLCSEY